MKRNIFVSALMLTMTTTTMTAQVYLDPQAPMEERVKDALSRMTTHEKIQVISRPEQVHQCRRAPLGHRRSLRT